MCVDNLIRDTQFNYSYLDIFKLKLNQPNQTHLFIRLSTGF